MATHFFLDTQFFDGNQYDFENKHFQQLRELGGAGWIQLLMPDITRREIERHIAEKAKQCFMEMERFRKNGFHKNLRGPPFDALAKGTTEETIRDELLGQFRDFCRETNAVDLPTKKLDAVAVLDNYFAGKSPFGEARKKHEFPDAFAAQVLTNWCEETSKSVVVVSRDGDWVNMNAPPFDVVKDIRPFLERLISSFVASQIRNTVKCSRAVGEAIKRKFEAEEFDADEYGASISDVLVEHVDLEEVFVTEAKHGTATVEATAIIDLSATVRGQRRINRQFGRAESDDYEPFRQKLTNYVTGEIAIVVAYHEDNPGEIEITSIDLGKMASCVDVSSVFEE